MCAMAYFLEASDNIFIRFSFSLRFLKARHIVKNALPLLQYLFNIRGHWRLNYDLSAPITSPDTSANNCSQQILTTILIGRELDYPSITLISQSITCQ